MAKSGGMAEAAVPFEGGPVTAQTNLGADGRLLIPAALRDAAGIKRGERIIMTVEDGRIVVEGWGTAIRRIQAMLAPMKKPGESVVDEFLAERRAESLRESEE